VARDLATIEKDKATAARAEADLKRTQDLASRSVASRQTLDQADADHKAAVATVAADEAALALDRAKLSYTKITAPISGRTGAVSVTAGNLVMANSTTGLVTITQITPIRVSFTLPERDLADLRSAADRPAKAAVRVYNSGETTPRASGELNFIDSSVDTTSGTILAKAGFANTDLSLWPGQYVDVEVDLHVLPNTVTVPTVSIQTGQKGAYVFVTKPDQTVEMRTVTTAANDGDSTAITAGLKPGERVVVEGQVRLADGARVTDANRERASKAPKDDASKETGPREAAIPSRDATQAQ
jgi:multidrug efflux system membrane fusion protein